MVVVNLILRWLAAQNVDFCSLDVSLFQRRNIASCKSVCRDALRNLHVLSVVDAAVLVDITGALRRDHLRLLSQHIPAAHLRAGRCVNIAGMM